MAGRDPFPRLLRWALYGAVGAFVLAFLLPLLLGKSGVAGEFAKGAFLLLGAASALLALFAVPVAVFFLVRGRCVSLGNVVLSLLAFLPLALVAAVAFTLKYGHFHI